jgi:hypothetical protein
MFSSSFHALFLVLILTTLVLQESANAFRPAVARRAKSSTLTVMAWSLQTPEMPFPKSTWYDDVGNPTFRRRVYDE